MPQIDCTDCAFNIEIGDGVKRSLIKHFDGWIRSRLTEAGHGNLASTAAIDRFAWRLAANFIDEIHRQMRDTLADDIFSGEDDAAALLQSYIDDTYNSFIEEVTQSKEDSVAQQLSEWSTFLDEIAETPLSLSL